MATSERSSGKVLWKCLWKGPLTAKISNRIFRSDFELYQFLFRNTCISRSSFAEPPKIIKFNRWFCIKNEPNCVNQFLRKKRHKKWRQECKQKQWLSFKFCKIFDILFSRTAKIAWWCLVFKSDFYMFSYNKELREI